MGIGQEPLGHAHRQEGRAALFDKRANVVVGLRISRAFAENDQRTLGAFKDIQRAPNRGRCGYLGGRRVDDPDQRFGGGVRVHYLREKLGRQVEIDAARAAGNGGADGARHADADVGGVQHAKGRLAQRPGNGQLIHFLVVALLQVDDLALGGTRD